jgi:hypothetical protein
MIYRRFGYLHARLLLLKQDEIMQLEAELNALNVPNYSAKDRSRGLLIKEIELRLSEYSKFCSLAIGHYNTTLTNHSIAIFITQCRLLLDTSQNLAQHDWNVRDWLKKGPLIIESAVYRNHPTWKSYSRRVRELLSDPLSKHWLDTPIKKYLAGKSHQPQRAAVYDPQNKQLVQKSFEDLGYEGSDLEEAAIQSGRKSSSRGWRKALKSTVRVICVPLYIVLWVVDITTALELPMLMNGPDSGLEEYRQW